MRAILFLIVLFFMSPDLFSQNLSNGKYWVSLSDKAGNGYSLSKPDEFLSQRALERRARQKISLTVEDMPVNKTYLESLESLGLTILGSSRWFNAAIIESYDTLLLDTLNRIGFVSEFDYETTGKKSMKSIRISSKSNAISGKLPENNSLDYGFSYPQISLLNGHELHQAGFQGAGMHIAVIDAGFFGVDTIQAFKSMWDDGRILGYRDFSRSPARFFATATHGMSVLSTMAANIPGKIIGTAPKASYWLLKSEITESETRYEEALWAIAAEFADSAGADIINSSLGYSVFDDPSTNYTYAEMDGKTSLVTQAADKAYKKGMIVVTSAGNEGNKAWKYITAPADGFNVLTVGAADTSGVIAAFSSIGPTSDRRIKPDIIAVGYKTFVVNSAGNVVQGNGTSYSAPQIAGMVACLWEAAPEKTNTEIIQTIKRSSSLYFNPNHIEGYGIPDFQSALFLLKSPAVNGGISVIPNPSKGSFEIRCDSISGGDAKVSLYNSLGKKVYSGTKTFNAGFAMINELADEQAGIYFIIAEAKGTGYFSKVIIL